MIFTFGRLVWCGSICFKDWLSGWFTWWSSGGHQAPHAILGIRPALISSRLHLGAHVLVEVSHGQEVLSSHHHSLVLAAAHEHPAASSWQQHPSVHSFVLAVCPSACGLVMWCHLVVLAGISSSVWWQWNGMFSCACAYLLSRLVVTLRSSVTTRGCPSDTLDPTIVL